MSMDPAKRAEHQARLRKLHQSYQERIPGELAALRELASRLVGTEEDREVLTLLRQQLHTIAGSGGTFGQAVLGEQARSLELTIISWLNAPSLTLDTEERRRLVETLAALPEILTDGAAPP